MDQVLLFAILGLGVGVLYAGVGIGLVTTYRGSGVINFGHAGFGLWGALVADELRTSGTLVLPWPGPTAHIQLGGPQSVVVAVAIGTLSATVLAALAYLGIFRFLQRRSVVAKILASIGLLTTLSALLENVFGAETRPGAPVLPSSPISLGELSFPADRLWALAVCIVVTALLWAAYRYSVIGIAMRASVQDDVAVTLAKWSPTVLGTVSWATGAAVTALLCSLTAPVAGLNGGAVSLLIVPGLAAMLAARLTSVVGGRCCGGRGSPWRSAVSIRSVGGSALVADVGQRRRHERPAVPRDRGDARLRRPEAAVAR